MSGLAKITKAIKAAKKVKKHGAKAGQKSLGKPSQKKSVKNGRHQEKETPKKNVKKAVAAIPDDLDGAILDDDLDVGGYEEPNFVEGDEVFESDLDFDNGEDE